VADALHAVATLRLVVLLVYFSQELQSNVLGLRRQSAKPVTVGSEPDRYRREFGDYYIRQGAGYSGIQAPWWLGTCFPWCKN
jgi:hypothetical protein